MGVAAYRFTYGLAGALASAALVLPAQADDADLSAQVKMLQDEIASQQQAILAQQQKLQELEKRISEQPRVTGNAALATLRGAGKPGASNAAPQQVSQDQQQTQTQQPVGQAPAEERPQVQTLSDLGGVLSRHGQMTLEPTFEYDNSQFNQLFFSGLEVVNAVFIGGLNATNARRNTLTAGLNGRYGITDYLEANLRVPYVYRTDRQSTGVNTNTLNQNVEGNGIGDVEFGVHYQINRPQNGGAYYVGNLRVKSNTGSGPFDVPYSPTGVALKDNTGSGFWAVEPSLTVLYPSDPVVLFGNIGYTYSFGSDPESDHRRKFLWSHRSRCRRAIQRRHGFRHQ